MRSVLFLLALLAAVGVAGPSAGAGTLTVTTDLVERFKAADIVGNDGDLIGTWLDSATGDGVSQNATASGAAQPKLIKIGAGLPNGMPVVRFDGVNDELRTSLSPGIASNSGFSYWIVMRAAAYDGAGTNSNGSGDYFIDRNITGVGNPLVGLKAVGTKYGYQTRYNDASGLGGPLSTTDLSTTSFQIVTMRRVFGSNFEIWVNGGREGFTTDTGGALTPDPINIAAHATTPANSLNGDIAELLVYKNSLSAGDFQSVGYYLAQEYGITTSFVPEPATLALLVIGGLGMIGRAIRRQRAG